ncbi:putative reverse transcriptase domain-containing protein [Tanacetum coccineum]
MKSFDPSITRAANALEVESQSRNGNDSDNGNGGNGNGNHGDGGNNGNGNPNENGRGVMPVSRVCTYQDFMKFQPLNFKGTEEVVGLIRWFEKMETVFHIINFGVDAAFSMTWRDLMKLMTEVFQELTLLCTRMVLGEEDRIESLMDQKWKGYAIRSADNKRKFESNQRDYCAQQPPFKRQNIRGSSMARAYTGGGNEGRKLWKDWSNVPAAVNQRAPVVNQRIATCFECGRKGHFKKDYPKLKNQNHGDKLVIPEARGKEYTVGGGDANPGSNVVMGMFLFNNYYASVLFNSGADQSFVTTTFSTLLDIIPNTLDISYAVELADRRIAETNNMLRGCTIGLLGHMFNIDLLRVELGSFDVIIGKDWLTNNHVVIVCDKNIKYMDKGCQVFLAQVTKKETEVKSKEKRLKDVPILRKILEVFPEELPGLPPARQVKFQIDLVPGFAPVA